MTTTLSPAQKFSPVSDEEILVPPGFRNVRHALILAKRNLIKTWRTPEQLIDVTIQPVIFLLLFVYVFGGAISGGSQDEYLQFLLPGLLGQGIALGSIALGQNMNSDIEKGVFDRFRSLPIARSAPLVGAVFADFFRYLTLCLIYIGFGYAIGFRIETDPLSTLAAVGLSIAFALCFCWISIWVGMKARTPGSVQGLCSCSCCRCRSAATRSWRLPPCPAGCRDSSR